MKRFPVQPRKRRVIEMTIRVFDVLIYLAVIAGGVYALWFTPNSVVQELANWEWLIPWWSGFLLVGGTLGAIGRITTIWILEPSATVAAFVGVLMYFVVLGSTALNSLTSVVAVTLVFCALLGLARRYLELQLFGSNPSAITLRDKLEDLVRRRIPNVPPRE